MTEVKAINQCTIKAKIATKMNDPYYDHISRDILIVNVNDVPDGISNESNARQPKITGQTYKIVRESLEDNDGEFHLKNKGIVIIAEDVKFNEYDKTYTVTFKKGQGIVDGGHTYKIIQTVIKENKNLENQYVTLDIRTGIKQQQMIVAIAGGLNKAVQVKDQSLFNLNNDFDWIKDILNNKEFKDPNRKLADEIAWSENDKGKYKSPDIIALLTLFNINLYPTNQDTCPIPAYSGKANCLKLFNNDEGKYKYMDQILLDILDLYEFIKYPVKEHCKHNLGQLKIVNHKENKHIPFFTDMPKTKNELKLCAVYPILGAMRWFVHENDHKKLVWKYDYKHVKDFCNRKMPALIEMVYQTGHALQHKETEIGKNKPLWQNLYSKVKADELAEKMEQMKQDNK